MAKKKEKNPNANKDVKKTEEESYHDLRLRKMKERQKSE